MRKCITYILFLSMICGLSGCDFMRRLASRPTSADIVQMKEAIAADSVARLRADSLEKERLVREKLVADSLYAAEQIARYEIIVSRAADTPKADISSLSSRYWLVTGVFSTPERAGRFVASLADKGFQARTIPYGINRTMVLASPCDNLRSAVDSCIALKESDLKIKGVWILDLGSSQPL